MPHQPVTPAKRNFARSMRRESTDAEDRLWQELRGRRLDNIKFRRQVPIGRFVADFLCAEAKLVVEIDGSQHAESRHDQERDAELKVRGFRVLRFWNDDVLKDLDAVCDTIIAYVRDESLQPWRQRCIGVPAKLEHPSSVSALRAEPPPGPSQAQGVRSSKSQAIGFSSANADRFSPHKGRRGVHS
ncbi:endonuclease domain-containing protein [Mesorhizobium sp. B2-8-9]|uniref:endonuclease domain-containing protein n=2 Tax=unclassified Mesorhizobium TaxID=325217 RepID=UPI0032B22DCF